MKGKNVRRFALLLLLLCLPAWAHPLSLPAGQAREAPLSTVYFPNWNVYSGDGGQVKDLPWGRLDRINHAFWKIVPSESGFILASADPWADTDPQNPKAHFAQYARYAARYPQTEILLSIGGWTCSGYFSQMCLTADSRRSFIDSCLETLAAYPFLAGLDLDWEYPGVPRKGGGKDEGNPVLGDDKTNYTLLLREMRAALDARFGAGKKRLTVCAAASTDILGKQDYAALHPYVDCINIMTYDMTGSSAARTGHHSPLYGAPSADEAVQYLRALGVPPDKIAIGSPLYSHGWKNTPLSGHPLGAAAQGLSKGGAVLWRQLVSFERAAVDAGVPGWHHGYDEGAQAAYLWNDDPASPYYRYFYTYENTRSLDAKLQYILAQGLGGLIVWQAGGDDPAADWPMLTRIYAALHP